MTKSWRVRCGEEEGRRLRRPSTPLSRAWLPPGAALLSPDIVPPRWRSSDDDDDADDDGDAIVMWEEARVFFVFLLNTSDKIEALN
jgi:hypothetical protein